MSEFRMSVDVNQLVNRIKLAASEVLGKDISTLRGFSERQATALAKQTALLANGIASGDIEDDLRDFFLDSLEDMALNFANTLRGLMMVTIEKVWNAIVVVLWQAIESATGLNLISEK